MTAQVRFRGRLGCTLSGALLLVLLAGPDPLAAAERQAPAADPRFAFAGSGGRAFASKFGLSYYSIEGNYMAGLGNLFHSANPAFDPPRGMRVVRKVAKLNVRTDSLGETNAQFQAKLINYALDLSSWYPHKWGKKPQFQWFRPKADSLIKEELDRIVETLRREKSLNPPVTGTVWEIGNEPNLFPAITPEEYAAIFDKYYQAIKSEDPAAQVALGPFFMPEPAEDLKAKLAAMAEKTGADLKAKLSERVKASGLDRLGNPSYYVPHIIGDIMTTLLSRVLADPTREYLRKVLEAAVYRPDLITLHVYPYDDRPPYLAPEDFSRLILSTMEGLADLCERENAPARFWITEFGNINQGLRAEQVAAQALDLMGIFKRDHRIERWFYYKAVGADDQFALFSKGAPPLTRLVADSTFSPADGNFPCSRLNLIGHAYHLASRGQPCVVHVGFTSGYSARTRSGPGLPIRVRLDGPSDDPVTVAYRRLVASGTGSGKVGAGSDAKDSVAEEGAIFFSPGETEKVLPREAAATAAEAAGAAVGGDAVRWILTVASGAVLAEDSLHYEALLEGDNAPPIIDSLRADKSAMGPGDSIRIRLFAVDADGDSLSMAWTGRDGMPLGTGPDLVYRGEGGSGENVLSVQVTDGRGGSVSMSYAVTVLPAYRMRAQGGKVTQPSLLPELKLGACSSLEGDFMLFRYTLPKRGKVQMRIVNARGRLLHTLIDAAMAPGNHVLRFHARRERPGLYYCHLRTPSGARALPFALIR